MSLRLRCLVWGTLVLPRAQAAWTLTDSSGCWDGGFSEQFCCGPPLQSACFNPQFTPQRCCDQTLVRREENSSISCLPLSELEIQTVLALSSGLDSPRMSDSARPWACEAAGFRMMYTIIRTGTVEPIAIAETNAEKLVLGSAGHTDFLLQWGNPLQSLLVCVPRTCSDAGTETAQLAAFVAERTLPAYVRPCRLGTATVLLLRPLLSLPHIPGFSVLETKDAPEEGLHNITCHSAACGVLKAATLPVKDTSLIIDIGAHSRTTFLEWLDLSERHWVIAVEPSPNSCLKHPVHPRLALLEMAVAKQAGESDLYLSAFDQCNSLLRTAESTREAMQSSDTVRPCLTAGSSEPIKVQVRPLATILAALPDGLEVAFLKVDAQGSDLSIVISAGPFLRRVRLLQLEVHDLPKEHPHLPYRGQPCKEEVVQELAEWGFLLEACREQVAEYQEQDCLFVRADLVASEGSIIGSALSAGAHRWDRPATPGYARF